MKTIFFSILFALSSVASTAPKSLYDIKAQSIDGKPVPMSQYKGKVLLIVNTASQCGFTPQLKDLETLYKKYKSQGFEILAFPSNDFKQDPASNNEILSYAQKNYEVSFPFFEKAPVMGADKQPVYQFLTEQKKGILFKDVLWNFEKFLVDRKGQVVDRWNSKKSPASEEIVQAIEKTLAVK